MKASKRKGVIFMDPIYASLLFPKGVAAKNVQVHL